MIKLYTDSTCDLSKEQIEQNNIIVVPLYVSLGEECTGKDGVDITPDKIYEWADRVKDTPKTAAFAPDDILVEIEKCKVAGDDMIFIGIGSDMSATSNVVRLSSEDAEYEDHVFVIDSKNLSTGIGLSLLKAAQLIREGKTGAEISKFMSEDWIPRVRASFVVETLTYLQRGGRCSATTALLANTLKIKPRIAVTNGKLDVDGKYRGKHMQVVLKYVKDMEAALLNAEPEQVFITHSGIDPEIVDAVREYLTQLNYFENITVTRAGAVISSHCGYGTLGVLFVSKV